MSEAYKCDRCGTYVDGNPYDNDFETTIVSIKIIIDGDGHDADMCETCTHLMDEAWTRTEYGKRSDDDTRRTHH